MGDSTRGHDLAVPDETVLYVGVLKVVQTGSFSKMVDVLGS